jgi:hypothetical protein
MVPNRWNCFAAIASLVMALQDNGASSDDIVLSLETASRSEAKLRELARADLEAEHANH